MTTKTTLTKPTHRMIDLYDKCVMRKKLSREEMDEITRELYGKTQPGKHHTPHFTVGDYRISFKYFFHTFDVRLGSGEWHTYYAPDRMSLRRALGTNKVLQIIEVGQ